MMAKTFTKLRYLFILGTFIFYKSDASSKSEQLTIANYRSATDVRDVANIDVDFDLIEFLLDEAKFEDAIRVYKEGSFSRSYAHVKFGFQGLPANIPDHSVVSGTAKDGTPIKGFITVGQTFGQKEAQILYHPDNKVQCNVGGNPFPVFDGCFAASGKISYDNFNKSIGYSYNVKSDNRNERSLQGFSSKAKNIMKPCPKCDYWKDFEKFNTFYGKSDYANQWIMAALMGSRVAFSNSVVDFEAYDLEARSAAALKAIVTMDTWMFVNHLLELAIKECRMGCPVEGCTKNKAVTSVDAAAAIYIGSLEKIDGSGEGKFMFSIADLECHHFKTCGSKIGKKGTSNVNVEVIRSFQIMQLNATKRECPALSLQKDEVTRWMTVPLIQGTLRYAYMRSKNKYIKPVEKAIGTAYGASVAPLVSGCSYSDAKIINDNMETVAASTDFSKVKEAFERQYACLKVKCADIGGLWDKEGNDYYEGAEPCSFDAANESQDEDSNKLGWAIAVPLFVVATVLAIVFRRRRAAALKRKRKREKRPWATDLDDLSESSDDSFVFQHRKELTFT